MKNKIFSTTVAALVISIGAMSSMLSDTARAASPPYSDQEILDVRSPDEIKVDELRKQEIAQLRIALGRRLASNRQADLYFRLAEIFVEAYNTTFLLEGKVHEKRLESGKKDEFIDRGHSRPYLQKSLQACQDILKTGIQHEKMDQIYYFMAFNSNELGNKKDALKYYEALIHKFPRSPYVGEAYRELGDTAFEQREFRKAQNFYEQAIKNESGALSPKIDHRLAWAHYRQKQFDQAITVLKRAIDKSSKSGEKFVSLKEEALRDMAIFMTESGKVDEAIAYFSKVAGDQNYYAKALERLGKQYERNVEPQKAILVYESLLKTQPNDEAAFRVRVKLIDLDLRRAHFKSALERLNGVKLYSTGEPDTVVAAQNLRAMIRRTATEQHEAYRKTEQRQALEHSEIFYETYLKPLLAQDDPRKETPEIQMYLADVKRELGKTKEASDLYRSVVDSKDPRYAKEAGALWTASLSEAIKKGAAGNRKGAQTPSTAELEYVEAADRLRGSLGDSQEGREAELKAAQVLAAYPSSQEETIRRIRKLIEQSPKSPQALIGARLWIQIYVDRLPQVSTEEIVKSDSGKELQAALEELRKNQILMQADQDIGGNRLRIVMAEQEIRFRVSSITANEKNNNFIEAAQGYERLGDDAPKREIYEKAYASSIVSFGKGPDFDGALRVTRKWRKRSNHAPGTNKLIIEPVRSAATTALIRGQFTASASLFEELGRYEQDAEALSTAALIQEGDGQAGKAIEIRKAYLDLYKKKSDYGSILIALAHTQELEGKTLDANKTYALCSTAPLELQAECGVRQGDLLLRMKETGAAKAAYRKISNMKQSSVPAIGKKRGPSALEKSEEGETQSPFIGYARFRLAELLERESKFSILELPEAQLKKAIEQRMGFLEPLSRAYTSAVEAGGPWSVAALDRLASWVNRFADEVDHIIPPASFNDVQKLEFKKSLSNVSNPLRNKAAQTWADAYQKAVDAEALTPALPSIADRLADFDLAALGISMKTPLKRAQGVRGFFRIVGVAADGGSEGRAAALDRVREKLLINAQDSLAWVDYGNLLWGSGKPLLSKVAYDRALALDGKNIAALNNRGVVAISGQGEEDPFRVAEANSLFKKCLKIEPEALFALMNRALLLNYYRVFAVAKPLWKTIIQRTQAADMHDSYAIMLQGMNESEKAEAEFSVADSKGASKRRFAKIYHESARMQKEKCADRIDDLDEVTLNGFEKESFETLNRMCGRWKK